MTPQRRMLMDAAHVASMRIGYSARDITAALKVLEGAPNAHLPGGATVRVPVRQWADPTFWPDLGEEAIGPEEDEETAPKPRRPKASSYSHCRSTISIAHLLRARTIAFVLLLILAGCMLANGSWIGTGVVIVFAAYFSPQTLKD